MPKYFDYKVAGYYLYFTSSCIVEAMHVHASDKRLTESGSAKFWVYENGDTKLASGNNMLKAHEIAEIQRFIKKNHKKMKKTWDELSNSGYYRNR